MTKKRQSLNDDASLAKKFVYGETASPQQKKTATPEPIEKETTVRMSVDLTTSVHRKLSILAAKTGKKKVEIIRELLDEALKNVNE